MKKFEKQLDTIMRCLAADKAEERERARTVLKQMIADGRRAGGPKDADSLIRDILLDLGVPDHLKGHPYLVYCLGTVVRNPERMNSITHILYPDIARHFGANSSQVERAIRHAIEVCWDRGDMDVLMRYFGNTISAHKGKPTNGEFIARIANAVRGLMQEAA